MGMTRRPQTAKEIKDPNNPLRMRERVMRSRREMRNQLLVEFEEEKKAMKEEIAENESADIIEEEVRKRQDWIQEFKEQHNGKPPEKIEKYHERKNQAEPLSPEEEEKKRLEDEEKAKKKKDKGKGGKKKESKGKKGKKGKDEKKKQGVVEVGPTEVVGKFDAFYEDYEN